MRIPTQLVQSDRKGLKHVELNDLFKVSTDCIPSFESKLRFWEYNVNMLKLYEYEFNSYTLALLLKPSQGIQYLR